VLKIRVEVVVEGVYQRESLFQEEAKERLTMC
jgi:hypothetical protein